MSNKKQERAGNRANPKKHKRFKGKHFRGKRLPDDFPGPRQHPILTATAHISRIIEDFERSGTLSSLESKWASHPGTPSQLPLLALLVAMKATADLNSNYLRVDITAVLAGLTKKSAYKLGLLCDNPQDAVPISYNIVVDQCIRLEAILWNGWEETVGEKRIKRDRRWFAHNQIKGTVPEDIAEAAEAVAIDDTAAKAWEATREYAVEPRVRAAHSDPNHEDHEEYRDVKLGEDGRVERGIGDARAIFQSGTNKRVPRVVTGYYHRYLTLTRRLRYHGDPKHIEIGDPIDGYIVAYDITTSEDPESAVALYDDAAAIAGKPLQVQADIGFTKYIDRFLAQLRRRRAEPILRQPITARKHPKKVWVGKKKREFWYYCGLFLPPWIPETYLLPPDNADQEQMEAHFAKVSKMALRRNKRLPGGMTQFQCPQCTGQMDSNRRTRRAGVTVPEDADCVPAEVTVDENGELLYCCDQSTIVLSASELRHFQLPPYGTKAHRIACGYRNPAEGSNSSIRNRGGLEDGWCRVFFKPAQFLGGLMLVLAHNTRIRRPKPPPTEKPDYSTAATDDTTTDSTETAADCEYPPTARPPPQPD